MKVNVHRALKGEPNNDFAKCFTRVAMGEVLSAREFSPC